MTVLPTGETSADYNRLQPTIAHYSRIHSRPQPTTAYCIRLQRRLQPIAADHRRVQPTAADYSRQHSRLQQTTLDHRRPHRTTAYSGSGHQPPEMAPGTDRRASVGAEPVSGGGRRSLHGDAGAGLLSGSPRFQPGLTRVLSSITEQLPAGASCRVPWYLIRQSTIGP